MSFISDKQNTVRIASILVATIAIATVVGSIASTPVAAQEAPETPGPPDPPGSDERANSTTDRPGGNEAVESLSPATVIESYRFENGTAIVRIRSEMPTTITITDVSGFDESSGAASFRIKEVPIERGRTTIRMRLSSTESMAVSLTTPEGVEQGKGVLLSEDGGDGLNPPVESWGMALVGGVFATIGTFSLGKRILEWRANEGVRRIDG